MLTINQEFANPLVAQHLHDLPEDSGESLSECWQARRWRQEVAGNLAGPMARGASGKDYFVDEVAMACVGGQGGDLAPVMVRRWFRRDDAVWARVNPLLLNSDISSFVVDNRAEKAFDAPLSSFRLSVEDLMDPHVQLEMRIPSPEHIAGKQSFCIWSSKRQDIKPRFRHSKR